MVKDDSATTSGSVVVGCVDRRAALVEADVDRLRATGNATPAADLAHQGKPLGPGADRILADESRRASGHEGLQFIHGALAARKALGDPCR